jgi:mercuric ion transport protein
VLIAGGALAGMGGVLADPCLIGAGAVLVAIAVVAARRRRRDGDSCCPPGEPHPETQHRTWTEEKSDHA